MMLNLLGGITYLIYIYIGQVKDPVCGREELFDGYVATCWRANGSPLPKYGGSTRKDLYLKMP